MRLLFLIPILFLAACATDASAPDPLPPDPVWRLEIDGDRTVDLLEIEASASDDALVVGKAGFAAHWDGVAWREVPPAPPADLEDIWRLADGTYLVAANAPRFYVFDDGTWDTRPTPGAIGGHTSIWGTSVDNVYLAGSQGRLLHVTPSGVEVVATGKGPLAEISHVWGSGPDAVWAVGPSGLFHWDGVSWEEVLLGITNPFAGMEGLPTGEFFMITQGSKLYTWNGTNWWIEQLNIPGVWGGWMTGPSDIRFFTRNGGVARWDDGEYTPGEAVGAGSFFCRGAGVLPGGEALIVERRGSVYRYDGTATIPHSRIVPPPGGYRTGWGTSAADLVLARSDGGFVHRNRGDWSVQGPDDVTGRALWGSAPDRVFAAEVGLLRFDGAEWTRIAEVPPVVLNAVHGAGPLVVAVGAGGTVVRDDGSGWVEDTLQTPRALTAVWTDGPDNIWTGERGRTYLARFDGTQWLPLPDASGLTGNVLAVWGAPDGSQATLIMSDESIYELAQGVWSPLREAGTTGFLAAQPLAPGRAVLLRNDGGLEVLAGGKVEELAERPEGTESMAFLSATAVDALLVGGNAGSLWSWAAP